jgi:2-polyprenyl-6-methoxyphenol hydroxylase-like FAD-dependent oxidoreductase
MVAGRRSGVTQPVDVLVVGAGPTGLTAALQAHDNGASVRVVERRAEAFRPSRAMIMHPRTMESLRPLGVSDDLLERGDISPRAQLHLGRRRVAAELANLDLPDTAFPHLTMLRQMDVEDVLARALEKRGVTIERGTELVDVSPADGDGLVTAVLRSADAVHEAAAQFVAGCDGLAAIGWRGGAYREEVVLADVELAGDLEPGILHVVAGSDGLVFVFALGEGASWRILATRPTRGAEVPYGQPGRAVPLSDVQRLLDSAGLGATVTGLTWSAEVRLQHRLADAFRRGPLFLAGDAAHAHSPAAAQGMNTGILDAVNLGWKLAFAAAEPDGRHEPLLASYEQERRPVARQVLALTHAVFFAEASTNPLPSFLRGRLMPLVAPALPLVLKQPQLMALVVRMLSQRWVRYRNSVLSVDGSLTSGISPTTAVPGRRIGRWPRPGDRLPDQEVTCDGRVARLHDLTAGPGIHVLLERNAGPLDATLLGSHVSVHRLGSPGSGVVAVRPDGFVGFRSPRADVAQLGAWLDLVAAR